MIEPVVLHGHNKPVAALKFNDDSDLLFTGGKDGIVNVWSTEKTKRLGVYQGHKVVNDIDVNHSSTLLATAGMDYFTKIWSVTKGKELATLEFQSGCRCVGFSHDDSMLFVVCDKQGSSPSALKIFKLPAQLHDGIDPGKLSPINMWPSPEKILYACWGPTNDTIYVGLDDGTLAMIDVATCTEICANSSTHKDEIRRVHMDTSNYYTVATASKDKTAALFDYRNCKSISHFISDMPVNDVAVSPKGEYVILVGGEEASDVTTTRHSGFSARFFHKVYGTFLGEVTECHFGTINRVGIMPNGGGFATGAEDGFAKIFTFDDSFAQTEHIRPLWTPPSSEAV